MEDNLQVTAQEAQEVIRQQATLIGQQQTQIMLLRARIRHMSESMRGMAEVPHAVAAETPEDINLQES